MNYPLTITNRKQEEVLIQDNAALLEQLPKLDTVTVGKLVSALPAREVSVEAVEMLVHLHGEKARTKAQISGLVRIRLDEAAKTGAEADAERLFLIAEIAGTFDGWWQKQQEAFAAEPSAPAVDLTAVRVRAMLFPGVIGAQVEQRTEGVFVSVKQSDKGFSATKLLAHLRAAHPEVYDVEAEAEAEEVSLQEGVEGGPPAEGEENYEVSLVVATDPAGGEDKGVITIVEVAVDGTITVLDTLPATPTRRKGRTPRRPRIDTGPKVPLKVFTMEHPKHGTIQVSDLYGDGDYERSCPNCDRDLRYPDFGHRYLKNKKGGWERRVQPQCRACRKQASKGVTA